MQNIYTFDYIYRTSQIHLNIYFSYPHLIEVM